MTQPTPQSPIKPWYQSRTWWSCFFAGIIGAYQTIAPAYHWDDKWVPGATIVLGALGLWGVRTATSTVQGPLSPGQPAQPDNVLPEVDSSGQNP